MRIKGRVKNFFVRITSSNNDVTGTCYLVEVYIPNRDVERYLVDCGIFMEPENEQFNKSFLFVPRQIKAVLLTHYHADHYGQIPLLYEQGFYGYVYASEETVQRMKQNAMSNYYSEKRWYGEEPYQESTVIYMLQKIKEIQLNNEFTLTEHVKVIAFSNRHAHGAVMFLLIISWNEHNIYVLFTGDYKKGKFPIGLEPYKDRAITIVTEGTYGVEQKPEPRLFDIVGKCFDDATIPIITSSGDDRFFDIIEKINEAKKNGIVPEETIIFVEVKRRSYEMLKRRNDDFYVQFIARPEQKNQALYFKGKKIIVTSTRGGTEYFLGKVISSHEFHIIHVNYVYPGSRFSTWINTPIGEDVFIGKRRYLKKARITEIRDFYDHSFADEIRQFVGNFSNIVGVFIGHGGKGCKRDLVQFLSQNEKLKNKVFILRRGDVYQIQTATIKYYKRIK